MKLKHVIGAYLLLMAGSAFAAEAGTGSGLEGVPSRASGSPLQAVGNNPDADADRKREAACTVLTTSSLVQDTLVVRATNIDSAEFLEYQLNASTGQCDWRGSKKGYDFALSRRVMLCLCKRVLDAGLTPEQLAKIFGGSTSTVSQVKE